MLIRSAQLSDLNACLALDPNSQTDHVWQMDAREEADGRVVRFHTVRLPRVMRVAYPRQRDDLFPFLLRKSRARKIKIGVAVHGIDAHVAEEKEIGCHPSSPLTIGIFSRSGL